ncbi:MAG: hypothetical protein Q4C54_05315, partial [Clostridia bacterium]|nr:hypothetical protein [Clostridia bacterium]
MVFLKYSTVTITGTGTLKLGCGSTTEGPDYGIGGDFNNTLNVDPTVTLILSGLDKAVNPNTTLNISDNSQVEATNNLDGTGLTVIDKANIKDYKYVKISPKTNPNPNPNPNP